MSANELMQKEPEQESVSFEIEDDAQPAAVAEQSVEVQPDSEEKSSTIVQEDDSSELENYSENVQKRINQLTAKRKQALEESEAAYAYARQVQQQNEEMKKRLADLDKGYVSEYGARVETQEAAVKKAMQEAYDAGDMTKVAEAQSAMSQLAIEKERLRIQKARSEQEQEVQQEAPQQELQSPQVPREQDLDPKLKSWMSRNAWFGPSGDMIMSKAAEAIHTQIVGAEGFDPSSDEYYAEIDKRMRQYFPQKFQEQRQNAQPVAPASNGRSSSKSGRKKTVELTPGQVAFAKKMNIPMERFALEVAKLQEKGK
jgi:hypothetical protein